MKRFEGKNVFIINDGDIGGGPTMKAILVFEPREQALYKHTERKEITIVMKQSNEVKQDTHTVLEKVSDLQLFPAKI